MIFIFWLLIFFIINILFIYYLEPISNKINIFDIPDQIRKTHSSSTPILGGLLIYVNLLIISIPIVSELSSTLFSESYFLNEGDYYIFFTGLTLVFFIGLYDDKYNLNSYIRLTLLALILLLVCSNDTLLLIKELRFSFTEDIIYLNYFSYLFTVFCFLLFMNATNMYDGINGQSGFYFLLLLIYIFLNSPMSTAFIFLLVPIIIFIYLNLKGKIFLGDGGIYILSFFSAFLLIKSYNIENTFDADQIFILMMLPGIELLRLAISRMINKKNPFSADRNHIHHLLISKYSILITNFILFIFVALPLFLINYVNNLIIIGIFIVLYLLIILKHQDIRSS
tara:strand:- start:8201 stop:9214 length:1014 start_codon:yes stop_codon:yes gene_type:complete